MRTEEEHPQNDRFLFADAYLSDHGIGAWKNYTIKRFDKKDKNDLYYEYIEWKRTDNEIAVFTLYSYANIDVPKRYDCIFNLENSHEFVNEPFTATKCIYEGWLPSNTIDVGHKHLLILEFENTIPEILYKLHMQNTTSDEPTGRFRLGLCNMKDFLQIHINLIEVNELKRIHGRDWWKYKKEEF